MKWPANSTLLQCFAMLVMIKYCGHYVDGAGYQADQSTMKGIDNGDNSCLANYRFEYGVDDGSAGQQFGHEEERNGYLTRGKYTVLLPDGRLQVVTYRADENGYKADVTYESSGSAAEGGYKNGNNDGSGGMAMKMWKLLHPPMAHRPQNKTMPKETLKIAMERETRELLLN